MNVLMLGWEFPPLFSGGLGVATYGLVKALRSSANIRLIVPRSDPSTALENVNVIGVSNAMKEQLAREGSQYDLASLVSELERIPLTISPYGFLNRALEEDEQAVAALRGHGDISREGQLPRQLGKYFEGPDAYGADIHRKVYLFSRLADYLSRRHDFRVIHAHDWVTFPAGVRIQKRTRKPLVLHVHALETDRAGHEVRNNIFDLEKTALKHADAIIAVSQYTREQIRKYYDVAPEKVTVVHNGIDPRDVFPGRHKLRDKLVVFLGRVTRQKGPEFLLETASKVVRVYPAVKFVVAGTGDEFAHLLEKTAYQKLGRKFIFTGFLDKRKVDALLAMSDVYFMPSVSEPFGLTALEAAQYGVPGVLSRQSGALEVLPALSADFWDTDKYANYIHALLSYPALHSELARKANARSREVTWDQAAAKIAKVYCDLTAA